MNAAPEDCSSQLVCCWQMADIGVPPDQCPLWVKSGHVQRTSGCPLCAKSRHSSYYSITWSARPISVLGMLRPSAFAVLRLMTNSTLVAC